MALFEGKKAFVTGGTTGIGRAIALMLKKEGAQVLICGRTQETLDDALEALGDSQAGFIADVSTAEGRDAIATTIKERFDGLDILINNAGFAEGDFDEEVEKNLYMIDSNYGGYVSTAKMALEYMKAQGSGDIVNIGSMSVEKLSPGQEIYASSKAAIRAFSTALAKGAAKDNIRVALIEPGKVGTDMQDESPEEQRQMEKEEKMLTAEDIADAVRYCLASPHRVLVPLMQIVPLKRED